MSGFFAEKSEVQKWLFFSWPQGGFENSLLPAGGILPGLMLSRVREESGMLEQVHVRRGGRELEFSQLFPAQAALNVIPVSIAGLVLQELIIPPAEVRSYEITTHVAGVFRDSPPCTMHWTESGRTQRYRTDPGTLCILSPQSMPTVRADGLTRSLALSLSVEAMEQALPEPFTKRPVMLASLMPGPPDRVLTHLLAAIEAEVKAGCPAGRLLLQILGNTTAFYLAQKYGVVPLPTPRQYGGLARDRLARVIEYIEVHLANDLSVAEVAGVACLSPYHFGKMFRYSMSESLHRYITRRRIERAQGLLRSAVLSLAEIAEMVGFSDQSHFTTVFKCHRQMTPSAYRRMMR
jgi:AraC family transcriptional regulator